MGSIPSLELLPKLNLCNSPSCCYFFYFIFLSVRHYSGKHTQKKHFRVNFYLWMNCPFKRLTLSHFKLWVSIILAFFFCLFRLRDRLDEHSVQPVETATCLTLTHNMLTVVYTVYS